MNKRPFSFLSFSFCCYWNCTVWVKRHTTWCSLITATKLTDFQYYFTDGLSSQCATTDLSYWSCFPTHLKRWEMQKIKLSKLQTHLTQWNPSGVNVYKISYITRVYNILCMCTEILLIAEMSSFGTNTHTHMVTFAQLINWVVDDALFLAVPDIDQTPLQ